MKSKRCPWSIVFPLLWAGWLAACGSGSSDGPTPISGEPPLAWGTPGSGGGGGSPPAMNPPPGMTGGMGGTSPPPVNMDMALGAVSGLRRLTAHEYDETVRALLGGPKPNAAFLLPEDTRNPFDNDYTEQFVSKALVEGLDLLAGDVTSDLLADLVQRDAVVGCKPTGPSDAACLRQFVVAFGRRALRRPLTDEEVTRYLGFLRFAEQGSNFYLAVDAVVRALLQDPEFLYRVEIGEPVPGAPGVFKLNRWELLTRLSYFLVGRPPHETLLDRVAAEGLATAADVRNLAADILGNVSNRRQVARFHALWLGYETLPHASRIASSMKTETAELLARVIFERKRPWSEIFLSDETFISDVLAEHYGLPLPGSKDPVWVSYGTSGRRGLLSHGGFLSIGAKFDDTSPTQRGIAIRQRLLCQEIPEPPPNVNVDDDLPPTPTSACKADRYQAHSVGGCAGCHQLLDPVGFGLERFDAEGKYRTHDKDRPECQISGQGEVVGLGPFNGPGELGALVAPSPILSACLVTQLYRFAIGRSKLDEADHRFISALLERQSPSGMRFDQLLLDLVSSPAFTHRREGM